MIVALVEVVVAAQVPPSGLTPESLKHLAWFELGL